jgi:undecaprenyl-diphosphatase
MNEIKTWDLAILDWIADHIHTDLLDQMMPVITSLGDKGIIWILLALILICIPKERTAGLQILLALGFSFLFCNTLLKNLVGRVRPFDIISGIELLIRSPHDYSFPSGHTSAAFAAATVLWLNCHKAKHVLLGLAVLMGFSRLYLYVHYLSDVLAGALVGIASGFLAVKCMQLLCQRFGQRKRR